MTSPPATPRASAAPTERQAPLRLSIVIPVFNEAGQIGATLRRAQDVAVGAPALDVELVVVDDGSTDGTAQAAAASLDGVNGRVVSQRNQGRYRARLAGLHEATCEYVLFLDSRVRLEPDSLRFVADQVQSGRQVWNGHVIIETAGNPFGVFWKVLTELAFWAYFGQPRTTSFGAAEFDRFPKGTTCFLAPRSLLLQAFARLDTRYEDVRHANDDTPIIRWIAEQQRINISPSFACRYAPRTTLRGFIRHAFHRGIVFLDGHGRRGARLLPAVIAFYPLSVMGAVLCLCQPRWFAALLGTGSAAGVWFARARGQSLAESAFFVALAPWYALAHGAGMWQGLALAARQRWRHRREAHR